MFAHAYQPIPLGFLVTIYQQCRLYKRSNDAHFVIRTTGKQRGHDVLPDIIPAFEGKN
jgi:hypothetical protein